MTALGSYEPSGARVNRGVDKADCPQSKAGNRHVPSYHAPYRQGDAVIHKSEGTSWTFPTRETGKLSVPGVGPLPPIQEM